MSRKLLILLRLNGFDWEILLSISGVLAKNPVPKKRKARIFLLEAGLS
jgi:hypothetical protein